jgi:hypothetical protein
MLLTETSKPRCFPDGQPLIVNYTTPVAVGVKVNQTSFVDAVSIRGSFGSTHTQDTGPARDESIRRGLRVRPGRESHPVMPITQNASRMGSRLRGSTRRLSPRTHGIV